MGTVSQDSINQPYAIPVATSPTIPGREIAGYVGRPLA